jgi:hypothetical protein
LVAVRGSVDGDLFDRASVQGRLTVATGGFDLTGAIESIDVAPRLMQLVAAETESLVFSSPSSSSMSLLVSELSDALLEVDCSKTSANSSP